MLRIHIILAINKRHSILTEFLSTSGSEMANHTAAYNVMSWLCRDMSRSCRAITNRESPITPMRESQPSAAQETSPYRIRVPAATPAHLQPPASAQFVATNAVAAALQLFLH